MPVADFDPKSAAKKLLREARSGALATLMPGSGDPYCSLANVASAPNGSPLLLLSRLAVHTKNILADPRISLMLDERKQGDPLEGARVMLMGRASATDDPEVRRRYLDRQPEAGTFAGFGDFAFYRVALSRVHLVAGFGRIVDLEPEQILLDLALKALAWESEESRTGGPLLFPSAGRPLTNGIGFWRGAINLASAIIDGTVELSGAELNGALRLDHAEVKQDLVGNITTQ